MDFYFAHLDSNLDKNSRIWRNNGISGLFNPLGSREGDLGDEADGTACRSLWRMLESSRSLE